MTVKSYLIEMKAVVPITLNDDDRRLDQSAFEQIMEKAMIVMSDIDLNELRFQLSVAGEVNEELYGSFDEEEWEVGNDFKMKSKELLSEKCPSCGEIGSLRKISYGMPSDDFNFDKYIVGGCMPSDYLNTGCIKCEWIGNK
jgi:hypothetical protein